MGPSPGVALIVALALVGQVAIGPEELLRRSDIGAFAPESFRARLVLKTPASRTSRQLEIWRSGAARTLVRFLDPKERGRYLLRLGGDLWLITPGAKRPVRLSPSYRLYGGATLDEVLSVRLVQLYRLETVSEEADSEGGLVAFELRAKTTGVLYPQVRFVVRAATERPVHALYRLPSGRVATVIEFVSWNEDGPLYARRVIVKDLLREGATSEIDVVELEERSIPEGLFDLDDPAERRALEAPDQTRPTSR